MYGSLPITRFRRITTCVETFIELIETVVVNSSEVWTRIHNEWGPAFDWYCVKIF